MNFFFCSANLQAIVVEQPAKREKRDDSMSLAKIVATTFLLLKKKRVGLEQKKFSMTKRGYAR